MESQVTKEEQELHSVVVERAIHGGRVFSLSVSAWDIGISFPPP